MGEKSTFQVNNFDLLRLLAALQVVVFHTATRFDLSLGALDFLVNAFPGVPVFFVISGFLISASYERSGSIYRYGKNRLVRILPALWVCIGLTWLMAAGFGYELFNLAGLAWVLTQLTGFIYTPAALMGFGFGSYNGALWTIPVELQFYVALPVLYWLLSRSVNLTRMLFLLAGLFLVVALAYNYWLTGVNMTSGEPLFAQLVRYTFVPHFYLFMVGVCLQRIRADTMPIIRGRGLEWLAVYLMCVLLLPDSVLSHVFKLMLLAVTTISIAYTFTGVSEKLLHGNDISYGVYIYHGLVHNLFFELGTTQHWGDGALAIVLTILLGGLSWAWIERPAMRRMKGKPRLRPAPQELLPVFPHTRGHGGNFLP